MQVKLWYLISASCLMMLYICIKFHENIEKGFRVIEGLIFPFSGFSKGHNPVKNDGRVMVIVLCILSDHAVYLYKVS